MWVIRHVPSRSPMPIWQLSAAHLERVGEFSPYAFSSQLGRERSLREAEAFQH
jgi:hypothetical protein